VANWIFQYRPAEYDLAAKTQTTLHDWWSVTAYGQHISVGDRVYLLRSGALASITAVAKITRATYTLETHRGNKAVDLVFEFFVDPVLRRTEIASDVIASSVYVLAHGMTGTNFSISNEQAERIDALLSERLSTASLGGAPELHVLKRSETALYGSREAIKTQNARVVALQVQFTPDPGQEAQYVDRRLENGSILLIGRGKRENGDQQNTHGNLALSFAIGSEVAFPVYEKLGPDAYLLLGMYRATDKTYAELDDRAPGYKVYRFYLQPWAGSLSKTPAEQDVAVDFTADAAQDIAPARVERVKKVIARNRLLADAVKRAANFSCERCTSTTQWQTNEDVPYVEVHHIIALGDDGFDNLRNMIALCSDCHRYLHLARDRDAASAELRLKRGLC
jgi:hypothetical protein